ncbi:MAG: hypothetical protein KGY80_04895 [Candidatus Thorarchaeota archaeon]|nr:hypothetical protein [Candidatus Thorarchaeota archaeon]
MSAATKKVTRRRMSLVTLISTMFLLATLAWALTTFYFVQTGNVRTQNPHEEYDEVEEWPYDLNWAGGRTNWFDDVNYTDVPMDQELPDNLTDHLEDVLFAVEPQNPAQLWRKTAYDSYSGSSWSKSLDSQEALTLITQEEAEAQNNTIYRVFLNVTVGPNVGSIELPSLFPEVKIVEDSFRTYPRDRLREYDLEIDEYGTVLFSPLLSGTTGENVLVSYNITYTNQDIDRISNDALPGTSAPADVSSLYSTLDGVDLTQRVIDNVSQFEDVGDDAYDKAMAVDLYFRNNFELMIGPDEYQERPEEGREVTDWFLERGGGLPMDFATAYSVFMRQLDIPARMVAGYAVGDAEDGRRVVKVKHMIFWSEVYIPTAGGGGEWIQVVPLPLTGDLGVTDIPENTGQGDVELWVWPSSFQPWAIIGEPFNLSSLLVVQDQPVSAPETIQFYDNTDDVYIGNSTIEQGSQLPLANITYTFPSNASTGAHNISATWHGSSFSITNYTSVYATGEPDPLCPTSPAQAENGFAISETVEMNLKLGLDNYTAYWEDTIHVHGVMTRDGEPVDGSTLDNDQMQIMWDEGWYANATIQSDGTYEEDIYVDPLDTLRMTAGNHTVWAQYAGEYTEEGYPVLLPARSEDNSTVTVLGRVGFSLTVSPQSVYRGSTIEYEGVLHLLNGTALTGEDIGIFFDDIEIDTATTNSSGGFSYDYTIPSDQSTGNFSANVNWTSPYNLIDGNWSVTFNIEVKSGLTNLSIESDPQAPEPVHIWKILTVNGSLKNAINGSGLEGYNVSLWWKNGTDTTKVNTTSTGTDGYYEFNYNVSAGYEGEVTYWVEFDSPTLEYESCHSENLSITVKRWELVISIETNPHPVYLLETVTINGSVYLPEIAEPLENTHLTVWWRNSTGTYNLTALYTGILGTYSYDYTIPFYHELSTAEVWANVSAPSPAIAGNESTHILQEVTNYDSSITVSSNSTEYYLNETAHLSGTLTVNGTPANDTIVYIHWDNGTIQVFNVTTDDFGNYDFYYNLTPSDGPSTVNVDVNFTSSSRLYDNATAVLDPLTLKLYQLNLTGNTNATEYHLDEVIEFSGTLTFVENGAPIAGETITVFYANTTDVYLFNKTTDSTGGFSFLYNLTTNDELGYVYLWSQYTSSNALWESAQSPNRTRLLKLYQLDLTCTTNSSSYYLNETVEISGYLTYQTNGTPIGGQNVTIFWDWNNGTVQIFPSVQTNDTGGYVYYYNLSVSKDEPATVTVWAESNNSVALWDNATSAPGFDIELVLYAPEFSMDVVSSVYLDQDLVIQGNLTYSGGSPALEGETVNIYNWTGTHWAFLTTAVTNSTGGFNYMHEFQVPPQGPGDYYFKCNYTSADPLVANATTSDLVVTAHKYSTALTLSVSPNPVYLNETLDFNGTLTFLHNSSGVSNAYVEIWWDNGTLVLLANRTTGPDGSFSFSYSKMEEDTIWTGIDVFANYSGTLFISSIESTHESVTLEQWPTIVTFDTGNYTFHPTDTVTITGNLSWDLEPDEAYGNAPVQVLFDGILVETGTTAADGTFSIDWQIPGSTESGDHDIVVQYWSSDNWIADYNSTTPITLDISRYTIEWTFSAIPNPVYLTEYLNVSGTATLDNGTSYAGATVEIYWDHVVDGQDEELLFTLVTNDDGEFGQVFQVDLSVPTGITYFFANCTPSEAYITSGSSSMVAVSIEQIPVDITGTVSNSTVYLNESRTFSGNLTFANGTAMTGYDVELYIGGILVGSTTVEDAVTGYFEIEYTFPWNWTAGNTTYQMHFVRPSEAYEQAATGEQALSVWDRVQIDLDEQSTFSIVRGESITVPGVITNGIGPIANLSVFLTANGTSTGTSAITDASGAFEITLSSNQDTEIGIYLILAEIGDPNYEIIGPVERWSITVQIPSELGVELVTDRSLLPGENFTARISLHDADGGLIPDATVMVYLNSTFLSNYSINTVDLVTLQITIPESWTQSGYFILHAEYPGGELFTPSSAEETSSLHIFIDFSFNSNTPSRVAPGQDFTISGRCVDTEGRAIINRDITINLNGSTSEDITTGQDGRISYAVTAPRSEGDLSYQITLLSDVENMSIGPYTVEVRRTTGVPGNTLWSIGWIAIIGIEVIVGLVLIRKYRYSVRSRYRAISVEILDHLDGQDSFRIM